MRRNPRRRPVLLFLFVFSLVGPSIALSQSAAPGSGGPPALGKFDKTDQPLNLTADFLEYRQQEDVYYAEGNVVVTQEGLRLSADRVVLENATGWLTAEGDVELLDREDRLRAERIELNVNTSQGVIQRGRIDIARDDYHIEGERMERLSEDLYLIEGGSMTTCDICEGRSPAWRIRAKRLRLRLDRYATVRGMAFYIKDIPVAYFPYLVFPVKTTRQSGFLFPRLAYATQEEGFKYLQPFFWAIGPSHDATLSFDYRSEKGMGGIVEYRYRLSRTDEGRLETHYFYDRDLQQEQIDVRFRHDQVFTPRLDLKADINFVNREDVRRNLSSITAERSQSSLESNLFLNHRSDHHSMSLLTRYSQDLLRDDDFTLQRLPEWTAQVPEVSLPGTPFLAGGQLGVVNFWRQDEREDPDPFQAQIKAVRADIFPRAWWPIAVGGLGTLTPHAGLRETVYSRGVQTRSAVHREIYLLGTDLQTPWSFRYGRRGLHWVEPAVRFEWANRVQDGPVPQFDQVDLADDKRLITYSLANRLLLRDGEDFSRNAGSLLLRLSQSYHLDPEEERVLSDLRIESAARVGGWLQAGLDSFFDGYDRRFAAINTDARLHASSYFHVGASHRYTRSGEQTQKGDLFNPLSLGQTFTQGERIEFITVDALLHIPASLWDRSADPGSGLYFASKGFYNLDTDGFTEIDYGLKLAAGCWEIVVDYLDFQEKNQINFMITLKGAVTVDSRSSGGLFEEKPPP